MIEVFLELPAVIQGVVALFVFMLFLALIILIGALLYKILDD